MRAASLLLLALMGCGGGAAIGDTGAAGLPDGGSDSYEEGHTNGGMGGPCPTEGPLWRSAESYTVIDAPEGLEHLVGATVASETWQGDHLTLTYELEGRTYTLVYLAENAE